MAALNCEQLKIKGFRKIAREMFQLDIEMWRFFFFFFISSELWDDE